MQQSSRRWLTAGVVSLVAVMPFHAFLVTWLGASFGHRELWQAWKEVLVVSMCFAAGILVLVSRDKHLFNLTNLVILMFALVSIVVSLANSPTSPTFWFGAKTDLLFLLAFVLAGLAATKRLEQHLLKLIIATSSLVATFGLAQIWLLPKDFLTHFGYGPTTILPYRLVDPAVSSIRIISTLGGPNQLGSFLILPITVCLTLSMRRRWWALLPLIACVIVQFNSFSRSAWLGSLVAVVVTVALLLPRRAAWYATIALAMVLALSFGLSSKSQVSKAVQFYLFHGQIQAGQLRGSDEYRLSALSIGRERLRAHPLGEGLGAVGPASFGAANSSVTENFYLQIGIETGVIGLTLFILIQLLLGLQLLKIGKGSTLAIPLVGTLAGLAVTNLFLHAWADSSLSLVYWTTAGVVAAANVPKPTRRRRFLGTRVDDVTMDQAVSEVAGALERGQNCQVTTVNAEFIMRSQHDPEFQKAINSSLLAVPDGSAVLLAALLIGQPMQQRVAGVDLMVELCKLASTKGWPIFILGGRGGVGDKTAEILKKRFPSLNVAGTYEGSPTNSKEALKRLANAKPKLLFVAYGAPAQDLWIAQNLQHLQGCVAMGIGGSLNFITGSVRRAPVWMQQAGLEWLHRLLLQPKRWRRMLALPKFIVRATFEGLVSIAND